MSFSQNVRFAGHAAEDEEFPHPAGGSIVRRLAEGLRGDGWSVGAIENWRDVGWSLRCQRDGGELLVALSAIGADDWLLQVAPARAPGVIGRLLGRTPSANRSSCLELAMTVHRVLKAMGAFEKFLWRWDGFPNPESSTPEPG